MGLRRQMDHRAPALIALLAAVALGGWALSWLISPAPPVGSSTQAPASGGPGPARPWVEPPQVRSDASGRAAPATPIPARHAPAVHQDFQLAVASLRAGRARAAAERLEHIVERVPGLVEAWVNLGFARIELSRCGQAVPAFERALALRPGQANAYYGLALCHEAAGELALARGAMRTFVHLADEEDPFLPRARAALWQWHDDVASPPRETHTLMNGN